MIKDRSSLILGVSGHRFLADEEKIRQGVEIALQDIKRNLPNHDLICLTSLAEGADRLVAKMILKMHRGKIWVALPFTAEEYCKDFRSIRSQQDFHALMGQAEKIEVMPVTATHELSYLAAGKYVLDHCDVLLVIWDGKKPQGRGGTGEIVIMARKNKQPIAWVHAGNRKAGTQQTTSLGEEQGELTLENFQRIGMGR